MGKSIVAAVGIIVLGAIVVVVLIMHPWRNDGDLRHDHWQHEQAQQAEEAAANAQASAANAQAAAQTPVVASPAPGPVDAAGQALTVTFPTEDDVEVYRDNVWVPARIEQRQHNQVFVRYQDKGGAATEWVGPERVRGLHR